MPPRAAANLGLEADEHLDLRRRRRPDDEEKLWLPARATAMVAVKYHSASPSRSPAATRYTSSLLNSTVRSLPPPSSGSSGTIVRVGAPRYLSSAINRVTLSD
ncbi:MAG: hypothetical protein JWN00_6019 [Actinomycetia bacterium]|nr:hypothetical protein [Actinomycetes bacterium]